MILEEITGKSIQELHHKDNLPKLENAEIFALNHEPSTVAFCSKSEAAQFGIRIVESEDYSHREFVENEEARTIRYNGKTIELWPRE